MLADRFDFSALVAGGPGSSDFGHAHGPAIDLRPDLPYGGADLIAIDLTHRIDVSDFGVDLASAKGGSASAKPGPAPGGTTYPNFTTAVAGSGFNITIEFKGTWTQDLHDVFTDAANRLASIITGDIPNVAVRIKNTVLAVDDIYITAELKAIDGVNGILGQAGPTSIRTGSYFPATASMQFDSADAQAFFNQGLFDEIVTHEMLHSVGFGSIWSYKGVVSGADFIGAHAVSEYQALLAAAHLPTDTGVPIEQDGGSGTAGSHWDEDTFQNELMTGYIDSANNLLSRMTAASLWDLGYQVNMATSQIDGGYVLT